MVFKINHIWNDLKEKNQIDIISHSDNEQLIIQLEKHLNKEIKLNVNDIKNNRQVLINASDVEAITTLGHMSQVLTNQGNKYFFNKRLKELSYLENELLCRVNQSTVLNINQILAFNVGENSRLEVTTKSNNDYFVSRHYAKTIKERLSC